MAQLGALARRIQEAAAWAPGARILAACSGGPDSLALLLGLDELRRAGRLEVIAAHVHHGLRGAAADGDLEHVAAVAGRLGVPFVHRRRDAAAERARRRRGLEEAARAVRREALEEMRAESGCDAVALAHCADDQAETMLLWLLRGAGPDGLSGMPAASGRIMRPLLGMRREELRQSLVAAGIPWRSDATNWGPSSARSLVREVVARFEASFDRRLVERLCETAAILREESAFLETRVDEAAGSLLEASSGAHGPGASARLAVGEALAAVPAPLARRLVRRFLRAARPGLPPPSLDATRRVLALGLGPSGPGRTVHVSGTVIRRSGDELVSGAASPWIAPAPQVLEVPGRLSWADEGVLLASALPPQAPIEPGGPGPAPVHAVVLDADRLASGIVVRARRRGDRARLPGRTMPVRVGEALAGLGVPADRRDRHPLVCSGPDGATVVWIVGLAASPVHTAGAQSRRLVRLEWQPTRPARPRRIAGRSTD